MSLDHARKIIEDCRIDHMHSRLHSSLGDLTPAEFKLQEMAKTVSLKRSYNYAHDEDQDLMLRRVRHYSCKRQRLLWHIHC